MSIRTILADDHPLILSSLRVLLEAEADLEVVGEARNGNDALALADRLRPDLAILDYRMPGMNGLELTRELRGRPYTTPVLLLSTFDDEETVREALRSGAGGFLIKDVEPAVLLCAARAVARGLRVFHPCVDESLVPASEPIGAEARRLSADRYGLTDKELEVVRFIVQGLSNKEIAGTQGSTEGSVKNRVSLIMGKMGLQARTQIAVRALREGLV